MMSSDSALEFIVNHIVLPPKLPQMANEPGGDGEGVKALVGLLRKCWEQFKAELVPKHNEQWNIIQNMLQGFEQAYTAGHSVKTLKGLLEKMQNREIQIFHIQAQNAGLFVQRQQDHYTFSCFELSAPNGKIMEEFRASTPNGEVIGSAEALLWAFPGRAVEVPVATVVEPCFLEELCAFLQRLCHENIDIVQPKIKKAMTLVRETRECPHPAMVAEGLMAILASYGRPISAQAIEKRIRDECLWKNSELAWKRSSVWTLLKVSIQLACVHLFPSQKSHGMYKNFMCMFVAEICTLVLSAKGSCEDVHAVAAKLARRARKLGHNSIPGVREKIQSTISEAECYLDEQWKQIQQRFHREVKVAELTQSDELTAVRLEHSQTKLERVMTRKLEPVPRREFSPSHEERIAYREDGIPSPESFSSATPELMLFALEEWVSTELPTFKIPSSLSSERYLVVISDLLNGYVNSATTRYKGNPEQLSIMLLTAMELWTVIDRIALTLWPILKRYHPYIPTDFLYPCLLKEASQMDRLIKVEEYLDRRWKESGSLSVFEALSDECLSVQFYTQSSHHRQLRLEIEKNAQEEWEEKQMEWRRLSQQYEEIQAMLRRYGCECDELIYGRCRSCKREKTAKSMKIDVLEWPLPSDEVQLKAAVFELDVPEGLGAWRSVTWLIGHDLGDLLSYPGLWKFATNHRHRVVLASDKKAFSQSHYRSSSFPVKLNDLYVKHGQSYILYDTKGRCWISTQLQKPSVWRLCQSKLPPGPYAYLQYAIDSTHYTSNKALASQNKAVDLDLHEHYSFASLRAGLRLQWLNISAAMVTPDLTLNREETDILLCQAALQAGPPSSSGSVRRSTHHILADEAFVHEVLVNIKRRFESVQASWKEAGTLFILITLTLRIASLSPTEKTRGEAYGLLRDMRKVSLNWARGLYKLLLHDPDSRGDESLKVHLLRAALATKATFDASKMNLLRRQEDPTAFVEATIYVNDVSREVEPGLSGMMRRRLQSDRRVNHRFEKVLQKAVELMPESINLAVQAHWPSFPTGQHWTRLAPPCESWVQSHILNESGHEPTTVLLNLLRGDLLVGGRPLIKLPKSITEHSLYQSLFGKAHPRVFVSDDPTLDYRTATDWQGYIVYFAVRESELVIQARSSGRQLELIPSSWFDFDLPTCLVSQHMHWMDLSNGQIDIRPLKSVWEELADQWTIRPTSEHGFMQTINGRTSEQSRYYKCEVRYNQLRVVNAQSRICQQIRQVFSPLEEDRHILVTLSDSGELEVNLPRYHLRFFTTPSGRLKCPELGAEVDPNQDIGAFIGLHNYIVLRSTGEYSRSFKRQMIVPYGAATTMLERNPNHVSVRIDHGQTDLVRYFVYDIDMSLRRTGADPGLPTLFKAYLHALTASVTPDPLTGRTGTEEALNLLRREHLLEPPDEEIAKMLGKIKSISALRCYYPEHEKLMQSILWDARLPASSQHEDFERLADKICESGARLAAFYDRTPRRLNARSEPALMNRARARNAPFRVQSFGGEFCSRSLDRKYLPRDRGSWGSESVKAQQLIKMIKYWEYEREDVHSDLASFLTGCGTIKGYRDTFQYSTLSSLTELDLARHWGSIFNLCQQTSRGKGPKLAFMFGMMAFSKSPPIILKTLIAIAISEKVRGDSKLTNISYSLGESDKPLADFQNKVEACINVSTISEEERYISPIQVTILKSEARKQAKDLYDFLVKQWPSANPSMPDRELNQIDMPKVLETYLKEFRIWSSNKAFLEHIATVQDALNLSATTHVTRSQISQVPENASIPLTPKVPGPLQLIDAVRGCTFRRVQPIEVPYGTGERSISLPEEAQELEDIISNLHNIDRAYAEDQQRSLDTYRLSKTPDVPMELPTDLQTLQMNHRDWASFVEDVMDNLAEHYRRKSIYATSIGTQRFMLRITIEEVLQMICIRNLSKGERKTIIMVAEAVTSLQRSRRLICLAEEGDVANFIQEAEHGPQRPWDAQDYPEWLALEVENDLSIRPLQAQVAMQLISPPSNQNSTLQLNMGEGKSAVIVHMVAASLANSEQVCRLLVLKPLFRQMVTLLARRHRGIAARPLFYFPLSRRTNLRGNLLSRLECLWKECCSEGGILLAQPEHILSFKLMGLDMLHKDSRLGIRLIKAFNNHQKQSRDVLDESDEILSVNFQLTYAIGTQRHLHNHPDRWIYTGLVLDIVEHCLNSYVEENVRGLTFERRHDGSFPHLEFIKRDIGDRLVSDVAREIIQPGAFCLVFESFDHKSTESLMRFLTRPLLQACDWDFVQSHFSEDVQLNLILIRGLLAYGILLHCLRDKRWLVNYGLDLSRSSLAVPYKAKGVPSPRSEFGHPDATVLLTHLSYYYSGLTSDQLKQCIKMLYRSPDPSQVYVSWVRRSVDLPSDLRDIRGVNLEDHSQFNHLWENLRYNKKAVDFFVANVVFPAEGKEFETKLSTTAWDIPGGNDGRIVTGFSGTNDNKSLLPISISQHDLEDLRGTNAMVMSYLLRPENRICLPIHGKDGHSPGLSDILDLVMGQSSCTQVLIDVGALIIEASNEDVAREWLRRSSEMEAAVFFDASDEMLSLDKNGLKERLVNSPYKNRLDRCLIYLDEFHTRGTDLKLPTQSRAAVTIAAGISKDRLVQGTTPYSPDITKLTCLACMRMRKLGHGQSIVFIVNQEVFSVIIETGGKPPDTSLDSRDILEYCLRETCAANQRLRPLWAVNGIKYRLRQLAQERYEASAMEDAQAQEEFLRKTREPDARTLPEWYGPCLDASALQGHVWSDDELEDTTIQKLQTTLKNLPQGLLATKNLHEEQEREIEQEVQRVEVKERPAEMAPWKPTITPGLWDFIRDGVFPSTNVFPTAGECLQKASFYTPSAKYFFPQVFVSPDFAAPLILQPSDKSDFYLRPVQFVLTSSQSSNLVVISPYEASGLLDAIRKSKHVTLHVYVPRVMKSMQSFDQHGLHIIGGSDSAAKHEWDATQRKSLALFAGQLYVQDIEIFRAIRASLHVDSENGKSVNFSMSTQVDGDKNTASENTTTHSTIGGTQDVQQASDRSCTSNHKEIRHFLSQLTSVRRKGKPFSETHIGALVTGRIVRPDEF